MKKENYVHFSNDIMYDLQICFEFGISIVRIKNKINEFYNNFEIESFKIIFTKIKM